MESAAAKVKRDMKTSGDVWVTKKPKISSVASETLGI